MKGISKMKNPTYKKIEITGSSEKSIQDAVERGIVKVAKTVRNMRWFELVNVRGHIDGTKVGHWQATVKIGFDVDED
jgi:flavin-binding protein dodecin